MANTVSLPETIAIAIGKGKSRNEIVKMLCNSGFTPQAAQVVVDGALKSHPAAVRKGAMSQIGVGALLFVIGLVITLGTLAAASSGGTGGFYIVSWGPMVFGAARILRGFFRLLTA